MDSLNEAVSALQELADRVRQHGAIAPDGVTLSSSRNSKGTQYAVLRGDIGNGRKSMSLGKFGGDLHVDWQLRIARRNLLQEIARRQQQLEEWIEHPLELPKDISTEDKEQC